MAGAEAADCLGQAETGQEFVAEHPMPDVAVPVEPSVAVVEPVDADVMQQAAGADQFGVEARTRSRTRSVGGVRLWQSCEQLLGDGPDDHAVPVDQGERLRGGARRSCRSRISASPGMGIAGSRRWVGVVLPVTDGAVPASFRWSARFRWSGQTLTRFLTPSATPVSGQDRRRG